MPQDQLRTAIDAIRSRVQAELDAQLGTIADQHAQALAEAERTAEKEAEQRWAAKVDAVRKEWSARLESEVNAARSEAERRMVAEATRVRMEAEQAAAESTARVREELEQALATERQRAQAQIQAERERAEKELQRQRDELRTATKAQEDLRAAAQAQGEAQSTAVVEARASERQAQLAAVERLLVSVRAISAAQSLSDTLTALVKGAGSEAPRVALFIANGDRLQGFKDAGFTGEPPSSMSIPANDAGVLGEALRRGTTMTTTAPNGPPAPKFASLAADRAGIAVPITVGDRTVAVLYADDGGERAPEVPAAWPEAVQILGRHASASLAHLTAIRTAQAMRMSAAMGAAASQSVTGGLQSEANAEDENGARRYARLLVSEIKLYNESAVQLGRQKRDLLTRLRPEIERARRLYEERVPASVAARGMYFHQELVQTLADGDPRLLGA